MTEYLSTQKTKPVLSIKLHTIRYCANYDANIDIYSKYKILLQFLVKE